MLMLFGNLFRRLGLDNSFGHFKLPIAHKVDTVNIRGTFSIDHLVAREVSLLEVIKHSLQLLFS